MFHQLGLISQIYSHYTQIHFFRLGPLYAFSRQTLRSLVAALVVPILIWLAQFVMQRILVE